MTDKRFAEQAAAECCSAATTAHHGGGAGRPFWNPSSIQFMYVPSFQFSPVPGCAAYRYIASDSSENEYSFEAKSPSALLEPIWKDLRPGFVKLRVFAVGKEGEEIALVGARTFYKLAPFPADLPPAARSYRDTALRAFEYSFGQDFIRYWLTDGKPFPDYDRYVYPSKMISGVIRAMICYSSLCPEKAEDALTVARRAADWLIGVTPTDGPAAGLPPTYYLNFRDHPETRTNLAAASRIDTIMMIYPAQVGIAYLELEKATGDEKYFKEALKIGGYYRDHVRESGSWDLIINRHTGETVGSHQCGPLEIIVPFLEALLERTRDKVWDTLAEGAVGYVETTMLPLYHWEGQFEDSGVSENYSNLTHYCATALIRYRCRRCPDDEKKMAEAEEIMRFVEDQFVVWKDPCPWNKSHKRTDLWLTPCGLEQYTWYMPIDNSAADIALTFYYLYKAGRGELYLEKAKGLADAVTRSQRGDGLIPTYWMDESFRNGRDMWISCMFHSARILLEMSEDD